MNQDTKTRLARILKDFGKSCYWYGEETGDYSMTMLDNPTNEEKFFLKAMSDIIDAVEQV